MKSALSDFILGKKGIYGILHIIILVMSLFLVISISVDTFKGIPFYTQSSYMKTQLWICIWFLFDFVLEFFLAKHKGRLSNIMLKILPLMEPIIAIEGAPSFLANAVNV